MVAVMSHGLMYNLGQRPSLAETAYTRARVHHNNAMRRPDIEEGDAAQPLLPESLDDEELAEGRQPSWWEPQNVTIPSSPALSAFANTKSGAGTPNGSRGLESGRQSPKTIGSGATRKSGKGGTRESRARHRHFTNVVTYLTASAR